MALAHAGHHRGERVEDARLITGAGKFTNTTPVSAYRGTGRPDAAYAVERLVDTAAAELGIDRAELRRHNFIPPSAFPYETPTGSVYDIADPPGLLEQALAFADWAGYERRREASAASGRLRGLGIATVIENTVAGRYPRDEVELELDAAGTVTVHTVSKSTGNSHETTLAMIVADSLDIPRERVKVEQCAPHKACRSRTRGYVQRGGQRRVRVDVPEWLSHHRSRDRSGDRRQ